MSPDISQLVSSQPLDTAARRQVLRAVVSRAPMDDTDSVEAVVPGFASHLSYEIEPTNWVPRGSALPTLGALCLLVLDSDGDAWLASYAGANDFGGGGSGGPGGVSYSRVIGDGVAKVFSVVHSLGTKDVTVSVYRTATPFDQVSAEIERTSSSTVTVRTLTVPNPGEYTVLVAAAGTPATGGGGGGDLNYVHNQGAPSALWTVNHNLAKFPAVEVVDTGASVVIPDVHYVDANTVQLTFGSATSGKAYVN